MWGLPGGLYYRLGQAWEACAHRDSQRVGNIHSLMYTSPLGILGWGALQRTPGGRVCLFLTPTPQSGRNGQGTR